MKSLKQFTPLVIAASAILFVEVALPLCNSLLEFVSIKLSKNSVHDQVEIAKASAEIDSEPPAHAIGFRIDNVDEDEEEQYDE